MIDGVVNTEKAVVGVLELINGDRLVLRIVALYVECKLLRDAARIDLCAHPVGAFVEQGQHPVVHVVVEQNDAAFGTTDKVADKGVGIKDLSVVEDAFYRGVEPCERKSLSSPLHGSSYVLNAQSVG